MQCLRFLFALLPCYVALASADPLPALVWTGDTMTEVSVPGGEGSSTDTGMLAAGSCFNYGDCLLYVDTSRSFTVTSPGTFVLSASMEDTVGANNCLPFPGCAPTLTFSDSFSSQEGVSAEGSLQFSNSNSIGPIYAGPTDYNGLEDIIPFSDSQSTVLTLGVGSYTLYETYNGSVDAGDSGDTFITFSDNITLVPTPEPSSGIALLAGAFAIALCMRARSL